MQKLSAASRSALASARQDLLQFFSPVDDDAQLAAGGAAPQHDQAAFSTTSSKIVPDTQPHSFGRWPHSVAARPIQALRDSLRLSRLGTNPCLTANQNRSLHSFRSLCLPMVPEEVEERHRHAEGGH